MRSPEAEWLKHVDPARRYIAIRQHQIRAEQMSWLRRLWLRAIHGAY